jgi:hypothetical protein
VPDLPEDLFRLVAEESEAEVPAPIVAVAEVARLRHDQAIVAVLFYGSCLRQRGEDGKIVDLFLLAEHYKDAHCSRIGRVVNALLPPNVYYVEGLFDGRRVAAKYALVTLAQFEALVTPRTLQPYFWARFAQPTVVLWARDNEIRRRVHAALSQSVVTMVSETQGLMSQAWTSAELWSRAFTETYRTELRAEGANQAHRLYQAFAQRYDHVTRIVTEHRAPTFHPAETRRAARRWWRRRVLGKLLSVLRLIKASFTFQEGAAYLVWKIRRHAGVQIELTSWQRRHPILASTVLAWRLYRAGGFR